jgi:glutathione synthase/RimK-type ligase-like ATP-grasp enzyme
MNFLLLVQEKNNKSTQLLQEAFQSMLLHDSDDHRLFVWEIQDIQFDGIPFDDDTLIQQKPGTISDGKTTMAIQDFDLVMKRTHGPIRKKGLAICKTLEESGVKIVNSCDMIEWTHSKIGQYQDLQLNGDDWIFPATITYNAESIESLLKHSKEASDTLVDALLETVAPKLSFPFVLKKDKGCKADGVYLIDSKESFEDLVSKDFDSLSKGFLLQEFLPSYDSSYISNYFRLNIVDGKIQSAVQFQLSWEPMDGSRALKLSDFTEADDRPVDLSIFPKESLQRILSACPYFPEVIGIDVMLCNGALYLLEYNDGPAVSIIVDLGKKFLSLSQDSTQIKSAQACLDFARAISQSCIKNVKSLSLETKMGVGFLNQYPAVVEATDILSSHSPIIPAVVLPKSEVTISKFPNQGPGA